MSGVYRYGFDKQTCIIHPFRKWTWEFNKFTFVFCSLLLLLLLALERETFFAKFPANGSTEPDAVMLVSSSSLLGKVAKAPVHTHTKSCVIAIHTCWLFTY